MFFLIITLNLMLQAVVWAGVLPRYSIDVMCDMADVIIEGTHLGGNKVKIDKVLKDSILLDDETETLEVSRLSEHSKTVWNDSVIKGKILETKKIILFLVQDKSLKVWESISTIDRIETCGSCGLFWYDDTSCYGYMQALNPGPYVLVSAKIAEGLIPKTLGDMRIDVATGLANSREWQRSLSIKNPSMKAEALARYLLKSTSPQGDKGSYLHSVREPMAALGKDAVPVLIHVLRTAPAGERLDVTILALYDIGSPSVQALPELRELLTQPERVYTEYVLSALGSTGDATAKNDLEAYAKSSNKRLAEAAKETLKKFYSEKGGIVGQ